MKHTFIHLSDLHYKPDWPEQIGLVYSKFIEDLKREIKHYESPYLVFSGDLVFAGAEDATYARFLEDIAMPLDQLGITRDRRIVVPGNHDVSRNAIKDKVLSTRGALGALNDEESFLRELPALLSGALIGKFDQYIRAEEHFAAMTCCSQEIGGHGWDFDSGLGIYCLNSALCSFAGLEDPRTGEKVDDKNQLSIDTRSLYQWEQQSSSKYRILVMHHPLEWLTDWSRSELETSISERFNLILFGHFHKGVSSYVYQGKRGCVFSMAPALFTRKSEVLGYSIASLDTSKGTIEIAYRQWTDSHKFVLGTCLAGDDTGIKTFPLNYSAPSGLEFKAVNAPPSNSKAILEREFLEASTCCSSKRQVWVRRDLSHSSETKGVQGGDDIISLDDVIDNLRSCVIRAPKGFGLSCLGYYLSLQHYCKNSEKSILLMCDSNRIDSHRQAVVKYIQNRREETGSNATMLAGLILDDWQNDAKGNKTLRIIREQYPMLPIIVLQGFEDFYDIHNASVLTNSEGFEMLYLRSLSRSRIRELVRAYLEAAAIGLDEDIVANKLIEDIDALNMHRTPMNCLLLLKIIERAFDDSPVNRTQMIGNVLFSLFHEFDQIPKYSTRPDLKDCEFALGYLCEWMFTAQRRSFTKPEFIAKVGEYCSRQMIEIDLEVLFNFLFTENILVRRGIEFGFRHAYWLFYFAAQRMHHSAEFASYFLSECRYTAFPEIIEFYTGIDRMRKDAVSVLTNDLRVMDAEFLARTRIDPKLNPFLHALWQPTPEAVERMHQEVSDSIKESALPSEVKDAVADGSYDRSKPYHQEIAQFITQSTLDQMIRAMKGAARALRNSDHVDPKAKSELLAAVLTCWIRMAQILVLISPVLSTNRRAQFEGMGFILDETFDNDQDPKLVWEMVMTVIVDNVVAWFQLDLFSKKLAPLFANFINEHQGELGELLVLLVITKQRPTSWSKTIEEFIVRSSKNSFYLLKVYSNLRHEFKMGYANEQTRQQIRTLASMAVAKHGTGVKHPNRKLLAQAVKLFDQGIAKEQVPSANSE